MKKVFFVLTVWLIPSIVFAFGSTVTQSYFAGSTVASGGACTTTAEGCVGDHDSAYTVSSTMYYATKFTTSGTGSICKADVPLSRDGSPVGTVDVSIWSNNATPDPDEPDAIVGIGSDTIDISTLQESATNETFININTGALSDATSYWVVYYVACSSCDASNNMKIHYETTSCAVESVFSSTDGSTWTDVNQFRSLEYQLYE